MEHPVYLGPMFVGHARRKPVPVPLWGCSTHQDLGCGAQWQFCPACGAALTWLTAQTLPFRPDHEERVQLRKATYLRFNWYEAQAEPDAEVAEHFWLPAPGQFDACLYVNPTEGQLQFAANLTGVSQEVAVENFKVRFAGDLALLSSQYQTRSIHWGFFCWL